MGETLDMVAVVLEPSYGKMLLYAANAVACGVAIFFFARYLK